MRGATHYDITMGSNVARDAHCDITMDNYDTRSIVRNYSIIKQHWRLNLRYRAKKMLINTNPH